jgi:glycosyltransferase involved in cell wall biosynthesis
MASPDTLSLSTNKSLIVCFSHLRWNFVHQRPQHLLTHAASTHEICFFEEPEFKDALSEPRLDLRVEPNGITVAVPVLPRGINEEDMVSAQRALLDDLLDEREADETIFWYYSPMALRFSAHYRPDLCVYDCMDELSAFRGAPPELTAMEQRLFSLADLVFTGGQSLYEAKKSRHKDVHAFPSSIDKAHFAGARQGTMADPEDQKSIPHPRIGFFGVVDERMDIELVASLADLRPDWHLVMIGPVVKIDPASLPQRPNIHWLGMKSYQELPAYLAGWDAGFMPFAINEATRFISPTKTPEFLSAGLPVVSTPVRDVQRPYGAKGLVGIAETAEDMAGLLAMAMDKPSAEWQSAVDRHLADMSWQGTWAAMDRLMRQRIRRSKSLIRALPGTVASA